MPTTLLRSALLFSVLAGASAFAQAPVGERPSTRGTATGATGTGSTGAWADAVDRAIRAQVERDQLPGLSCAVGIGDAMAFERGYGQSDLENGVVATSATVYRLASISKPITSVCALQLYEAGKLDLDQDIQALLPAWPAKKWPVTTRQLLAHLGGVRHYRPGETESTFHYQNQTDALMRFAGDPLLHEPGTAYHYSTFGFNLVAAVVERLYGQPFTKVVHDHIALPSAAATLQDDDVRRVIRGRAQGYVFVDGVLQNSELMDSSYKLGGGGLCASAPDLVRFAQALMSGKLLRPETLAMMWSPQTLKGGGSSDYGLGFRISERDGRRVVQHGGAQSRVSTMLYLLPDQQVAVVLLCNLEKVRLLPLAQQIADLVAPPSAKNSEKKQ
jgi:serine beta-lactamase-like protein LACTB, mitochondrial